VKDRLGNGDDAAAIGWLSQASLPSHAYLYDFTSLPFISFKITSKHSTARLRGPQDLEPTEYCS
jgi:hypothetical protein